MPPFHEFYVPFTIGSDLGRIYREEDVDYSPPEISTPSDVWSSNYDVSDSEASVSEDPGAKSDCSLEPGEFIYSNQESTIYLPNIPTSTLDPVCINCGKILEVLIPGCRDPSTCIICHWPMCRDGCDFEGSVVRNAHSALECSLLYEVGCKGFLWNGDPALYIHLWVVRFALLKTMVPDLFEKVIRSCSFPEDTSARPELNSDEIVDVTSYWFPKIAEVTKHEELVKIGQVVLWKMNEINGMNEMISMHRRFDVQPLILSTAFAHSCCPNLKQWSPTDPCKFGVVRSVKPGEALTMSFDAASVFSPTSERIQRLMEMYSFRCTCSRCADPTEFGTNFSAFPCSSAECLDKILPCESKLDVHPTIWQPVSYIRTYKRNKKILRCPSCKNLYTSEQMLEFKQDFQNRIRRSWNSLVYLNLILKRENRLRRLHCTNYLFFEASWRVLELLSASKDITDISFLEEAIYMDYVLPAESVHFVIKSFSRDLFSQNLPVFRVIALIRLAVLTADLLYGNVTLPDVERRLKDIYGGWKDEPMVLSTVSKCQLFIQSGNRIQPGSFQFVEHHGVKVFVEAIEDYLIQKTIIFKLRRLAHKE